ncbi:hypothetical protein BKA66DRAFT_140179 [Pyrenochaeta sp. MPI-SDFR-AT-0127]|nr:hypothetical protein BKA66DRAFT_140179 [Pyrenochaeta sp. MPI-SDFR-AT-0127]
MVNFSAEIPPTKAMINHDTVYMKTVAALRQKEMENVDITHSPMSPVAPTLRRNERFKEASARPSRSFSQLARTPMTDHKLIPQPLSLNSSTRRPKGPTMPAHGTAIEKKFIQNTLSTVSPTRNPSSCTTSTRLYTIFDEQPPTYKPTSGSKSLPLIVSSQGGEKYHTQSEPPAVGQESTKAMSTTDSVSMSGGLIHIKPSSQLQSMQAVKKHLKDAEDFHPYGPWTRNKVFRTQSDISLPLSSYVPSGSPRAVFKRLEDMNESRVNDPSLDTTASDALERRRQGKDWKTACDWTEPEIVVDGPTEWIEGYLVRKAEADRREEEQRKLEARAQRWDLSRVDSLKQVNKIVRRLSGSTKKEDRDGFEVRREHDNDIRKGQPPIFGQSSAPEQMLQQAYLPPLNQRHTQEHSISPRSSRSEQINEQNSPKPTQSTYNSPSRPRLGSRFHTVSGASLSKFLLRKLSLRQVDQQGEDFGLRRSLSIHVPKFLGHRRSSMKDLSEALEKPGKEERDERNRKDSGKGNDGRMEGGYVV